jgi:hypothetical protein
VNQVCENRFQPPPLFLLFLQEIISGGELFPPGILDRQGHDELKNSETTACTAMPNAR